MASNVTDISAAKKPGGETAMPDRAVLSELRRKVNGFKSTMDEARGEMGNLYKGASDNQNVHKKAFKLVNAILSMDDEKRDAFLAHFDHYCEVMGVNEGRTPDMFDGVKAAAE